jgi:hypothetical protein
MKRLVVTPGNDQQQHAENQKDNYPVKLLELCNINEHHLDHR